MLRNRTGWKASLYRTWVTNSHTTQCHSRILTGIIYSGHGSWRRRKGRVQHAHPAEFRVADYTINDVLDLASLKVVNTECIWRPTVANELCQVAMVSLCIVIRKSEVLFHFRCAEWLPVCNRQRTLATGTYQFPDQCGETHGTGWDSPSLLLRENPGKITFSVADTGPGFRQTRQIAFRPVQQAGWIQTGTGLGLNICSIIAGRLKGEVKLDKNYTEGARFLFILPLDSVPDK